MSTEFIKWHTKKELEKQATLILEKYSCEAPVDIDYVIEMVGLEIMDVTRLKEDFGLYGLLGKVKDNFTIFVQKGDFKETNYHTNFTLAEELSHYILHKKYFLSVKNLSEAFMFYKKLKGKSEMMMELNAKYLAGAILLPSNDLKAKANHVYRKNAEIFCSLLDRDCDSIIAQIAVVLSDIYRVPDGAIAYRLKSKELAFKDFLKKEFKK